MAESTAPRIRFAGFTDAWEQRRLGDVARFSKGVGYSKSDITDEGEPLFLYGRLYTSYSTTVTNVDTYANPLPGSVRSVGNEVVTPASGETAEDIAVASAILSPGILLGGGLNIVIPEQFLDTVFLALSITSGGQHDELAQSAQGKTVVHLYNADLAASHVRYPPLPEQRRIGELFSALDNLITLHQRKPIPTSC